MPRSSSRKPKSRLPEFISPQLATLTETATTGDEWIYEVKWDGYRLVARCDSKEVRLFTRAENDWTEKFQLIADDLTRLKAANAILDGEVCFLRDDGTSDFQQLVNTLEEGQNREQLYYVAFDLMFLDGEDLRELPQIERKQRLAALLKRSPLKRVVFSEHVQGDADALLADSCKRGLEGVMAKKASASYLSRRTDTWLKLKCSKRQEFVIGGYTEPQGSRQGFGALLLGVYDQGKLIYTGNVGTGFTEDSLNELMKRFRGHELNESPFAETIKGKQALWLEPRFVAEVKFTEWTEDGRLRHPVFMGLRDDKRAKKIFREEAKAMPNQKSLNKKSVVRVPTQLGTSKGKSRPAASAGREKVAKPKGKKIAKKASPTAAVAALERLTHPDKILYAKAKVTKRQLAQFYIDVLPAMWPHAEHRPLMLLRCPEGAAKACFYQKKPPTGKSAVGLAVVDLPPKTSLAQSFVLEDPEGFVSLVQMGSLELHGWQCRSEDVEHPDQIIFDLDPDVGLNFDKVIKTAMLLKNFLNELGLESFVKLSGGKGVHVQVPLEPVHTWEQAKSFSKSLADALAVEMPNDIITKSSKVGRKGKIFIDYLRNGFGSTAALPYSVRAKPNAPVAMPIEWADLAKRKYEPQSFGLVEAVKLIKKRKKDPWADYFKIRQRLPKTSG